MYQAAELLLQPVRTAFRGEINDVIVCRDIASRTGNMYTVIAVKDGNYGRKLLDIIENREPPVHNGKKEFVCVFQENGTLNFAFKYQPERKMTSFAPGQLTLIWQIEETGCSLTQECMTSALPPQLLLLALTDDNINLNVDGSVYFNMFIDVSKLDAEAEEKQCVNKCAEIVASLFDVMKKNKRDKIKSRMLLDKKVSKAAYNTFSELYHDLRMTELSRKKQGLWSRIKGFFSQHSTGLFRLLLAICVLAAIVAVIMLLSHFLFGNALFLFRRNHSLDVIGTEILR